MVLMKEEYQGISTVLAHDFNKESNCCKHYPVLTLECNSLGQSCTWKFELIKCILIPNSYKIIFYRKSSNFLHAIFSVHGKLPLKLSVQKLILVSPHLR